jgi:hypothetical protein
MKTKKGSVYFFKHLGIDAIKIGFSDNESPLSRFEQMKTYSPYGAEIIGFIICENPKKLETDLHKKFNEYRLNGEWFNISIEKVKETISFHTNLEDLKERNDFEIEWLRKKNIFKSENYNNNLFDYIFSTSKKEFYEEVVLSQNEILNILNQEGKNSFDKKELKDILSKLKIDNKIYNIKGKYKRGFKLYAKS